MANVTAIVKDPAGNIYANALVIASFVGQNTTPGAGPYITGGVPQGQFETVVPGNTDSFGALAMPITGNDTITPSPSQWKFTVVSSTTPPVSFAVLITITGVSQDISAALQAAAASLIPNTNFSNVGVITLVELPAAPPGTPNATNVWANGTKTFTHRLMANENNAGSFNSPIALFSDPLSVFSPTTSAQLASIMSDETGTGALVFGTGPALASPVTTGTDNGVETLQNKTLVAPVINSTPTGTGIPTVTLKTGTGAGNYTTTSTTFVRPDATNLAFAVTIPVGWKLLIAASGGVSSSTGAGGVNIALADGSADNTGILVSVAVVPSISGAGSQIPWALNWMLNGDGASHTINLQFNTGNAADAAILVNAGTLKPVMTFLLTPSN